MMVFEERGKRSARRKKTSRSKERTNNKLNPHRKLGPGQSYDTWSRKGTRATLVGGEHSHHFTTLAPQMIFSHAIMASLAKTKYKSISNTKTGNVQNSCRKLALSMVQELSFIMSPFLNQSSKVTCTPVPRTKVSRILGKNGVASQCEL